jgi:hypothetical protein
VRSDQVVAVGLFTQRDIEALGNKLSGIYMIAALDDGFDDLLAQLNQMAGTPERDN